ncbi:phosphate ABC transporter substrate-binding protein [Novosphingobium marinum]|uniref:Phosphate transport system substrate-binding protein n=1 Tax=Novosphingobium marinum TaxID=1514948 RepID=A0A7Z0BWD8_9SPHN|nr:substrate-binding domain-containing protein [Novosphingobium marinum]NYH96157.1 phosphate transport system substrate-binding protein [Novosphingobium marinum]GGC32912.1 phosphate ABC transporter substrate-binding protein [Novosphingobium marinum]
MKSFKSLGVAALLSASLAACGGSGGGSSEGPRDFVRAVGSSTVYPFATAVAEQVGKQGGKSPVIESTGTGGGMKLFCAGIGSAHPDVENASRRMKLSEFEQCQANGVNDIVEIQIGIDGIAFGEAQGGPDIELTPQHVYEALAANPYGEPNTAKNWNDVDPSLPNIPILVYGPPSTSGTRDALEELILAKGCDSNPEMVRLKESDEDRHEAICTQIREDGAYVDSGENDNLIVQKISQNPRAVGVFGFSFLEENMDTLKGIPMSGIEPTYETISDFSYPGARPLYIYVKKAHMGPIKGLEAFVREWPNAWGPDGYLKQKGMVIAPEDVRARNAEVIANMTTISAEDLK